MKRYDVHLTDEPDENGFQPHLVAYILDPADGTPRPAVLICPGGGYEVRSEYGEGERYAMPYTAAGFDAFVVNYTVRGGGVFPRQIRELAQAVAIVRDRADEWQIDPHKIAVCGSSAGAHLAASLSTLWDNEQVFTKEEIASRRYRPDATVLCYPVITSGNKAHKGSFRALLGTKDEHDPLWELVSVEKQVDANTPPAFIWQCVDDDLVPVENSFYYAQSLREHGVPFELHIWPHGGHGKGLLTKEDAWWRPMCGRAQNWHKLSVDWLAETFGL